jgi:hypothetical protein
VRSISSGNPGPLAGSRRGLTSWSYPRSLRCQLGRSRWMLICDLCAVGSGAAMLMGALFPKRRVAVVLSLPSCGERWSRSSFRQHSASGCSPHAWASTPSELVHMAARWCTAPAGCLSPSAVLHLATGDRGHHERLWLNDQMNDEETRSGPSSPLGWRSQPQRCVERL